MGSIAGQELVHPVSGVGPYGSPDVGAPARVPLVLPSTFLSGDELAGVLMRYAMLFIEWDQQEDPAEPSAEHVAEVVAWAVAEKGMGEAVRLGELWEVGPGPWRHMEGVTGEALTDQAAWVRSTVRRVYGLDAAAWSSEPLSPFRPIEGLVRMIGSFTVDSSGEGR